MNKKALIKFLKKNKFKGTIYFTYYTKTGATWICNVRAYHNNNEYKYFTFDVKVGGYGYDKMSTCLSNSLNIFKDSFKRYKFSNKNNISYGLYDDNSISYGIGVSAVYKCIKCFKNVKILNVYSGINENCLVVKVL